MVLKKDRLQKEKANDLGCVFLTLGNQVSQLTDIDGSSGRDANFDCRIYGENLVFK